MTRLTRVGGLGATRRKRALAPILLEWHFETNLYVDDDPNTYAPDPWTTSFDMTIGRSTTHAYEGTYSMYGSLNSSSFWTVSEQNVPFTTPALPTSCTISAYVYVPNTSLSSGGQAEFRLSGAAGFDSITTTTTDAWVHLTKTLNATQCAAQFDLAYQPVYLTTVVDVVVGEPVYWDAITVDMTF